MAQSQPEWKAPKAPAPEVLEKLPKLRVWNSLTRSKNDFVPLDLEGRKVGWYVCGPTVYDDSHLGHARNYVSTDIIRRIVADYFNFDLTFVMNITDVDDKIILAARQQHLLSQYLSEHSSVDQEIEQTTKAAYEAYVQKNLPLITDLEPEAFAQAATAVYGHVLDGKAVEGDGPPGDKEAKIKMHLNTARSASEAVSEKELSQFALKASGVLLPYIDSQRGSSISGSDHHIFTALTRRYEDRFFDDMKSLNVQYPDKVTRVTEYGPQIVDFVKQIQDNGFAYENEGSVYYDTTSWESQGGVYARLEPWNRNDKDLQQDGEGSLAPKKTSFKRSGADFALWKASKAGEPSWQSPWGEGRPGWHIECSAMASDVFGKTFDIHSGGIDLAFPHHDNELAQSEAYWCEHDKLKAGHGDQWVNYFLHMGHLSIQGSKMSKSLKNFTTIREALSRGDWTSRGLRTVFLLGNWRDGLEITSELVKASLAWEEKVNNFFLRTRDVQKNPVSGITNGVASLKGAAGQSLSSVDLLQTLEQTKVKFHDAMCDSFDTPTAMRAISDLITTYNSEKQVPSSVSLALGEWVTVIVHLFGLDMQPRQGHEIGWSGLDIPEAARAYIYPLASLRDKVRENAIAGGVNVTSLHLAGTTEASISSEARPYAQALADFQGKLEDLQVSNADAKAYLAASDHVRDVVCWNLDIYLEDRENLPALVRPLSQSLRQERQDKEAIAAAKAAAKEKARLAKAAEEKKKLEQGKLSHLEMFRTSEYSAWDEGGLPTKDAEGKEVAKARGKKLKKDWERQRKLHEAYLTAQRG
ncbi:hypothetical protein K431DRAFT_281174 [Polychaeton citri CBS 116435]|uniref:cysteine--tRNA ligase n=1 Tax=Polychaeton citri CBS 116435 TaxID=1314669 RepID=A0A9P4UU07_9PEZI|nr:hypothetical protein K431DRAFT_281174 [Polychaeton citri CBS 116435]